jgi:hypothetical protein
MDQGNYREARGKLKEFMEGKSVAGDEFMPPAWWMLAWCILNEGGKENILDAAERFFMYAKTWPVPGERSSYSTVAIAADYEELTKAAYFNRAVIYADLLNTTEGEQKKYKDNATESLNQYLERWPNDPRASAVRNLLDSLNGYHPRP